MPKNVQIKMEPILSPGDDGRNRLRYILNRKIDGEDQKTEVYTRKGDASTILEAAVIMAQADHYTLVVEIRDQTDAGERTTYKTNGRMEQEYLEPRDPEVLGPRSFSMKRTTTANAMRRKALGARDSWRELYERVSDGQLAIQPVTRRIGFYGMKGTGRYMQTDPKDFAVVQQAILEGWAGSSTLGSYPPKVDAVPGMVSQRTYDEAVARFEGSPTPQAKPKAQAKAKPPKSKPPKAQAPVQVKPQAKAKAPGRKTSGYNLFLKEKGLSATKGAKAWNELSDGKKDEWRHKALIIIQTYVVKPPMQAKPPGNQWIKFLTAISKIGYSKKEAQGLWPQYRKANGAWSGELPSARQAPPKGLPGRPKVKAKAAPKPKPQAKAQSQAQYRPQVKAQAPKVQAQVQAQVQAPPQQQQQPPVVVVVQQQPPYQPYQQQTFQVPPELQQVAPPPPPVQVHVQIPPQATPTQAPAEEGGMSLEDFMLSLMQ